MKHDVRRNDSSARALFGRNRDVNAQRQDVGQIQQREGGLVRENPGLLRPEPDDRQIFMVSWRKLGQSVDPALRASDATAVQVVIQELRRHARLLRLPCREVALLTRGGVVKLAP